MHGFAGPWFLVSFPISIALFIFFRNHAAKSIGSILFTVSTIRHIVLLFATWYRIAPIAPGVSVYKSFFSLWWGYLIGLLVALVAAQLFHFYRDKRHFSRTPVLLFIVGLVLSTILGGLPMWVLTTVYGLGT